MVDQEKYLEGFKNGYSRAIDNVIRNKGISMGLTLDELYEIKNALLYGKFVDSYLDECEESLKLIEREIKLKETNFITMTDVNGNPMDGGE